MVGMSGRFGAGHCRQVLAVVTRHTWMAAKGWDFPLEGDKYHPKPQPVWNEAQTVSWTFFLLCSGQLICVFRGSGTLIRTPCVSALQTWDKRPRSSLGWEPSALTVGCWSLSKMRSTSGHTPEFSHTVPTQSCTAAVLAVESNSCSSVLDEASPSGTAILELSLCKVG